MYTGKPSFRIWRGTRGHAPTIHLALPQATATISLTRQSSLVILPKNNCVENQNPLQDKIRISIMINHFEQDSISLNVT